MRIRAVEERGDLIGVVIPARLGRGNLGVVAGFRGPDEIGGDEDVIAQQRRQLVGVRAAVERGDGVADVGLILEQALRRQLRVGRARPGVESYSVSSASSGWRR